MRGPDFRARHSRRSEIFESLLLTLGASVSPSQNGFVGADWHPFGKQHAHQFCDLNTQSFAVSTLGLAQQPI